MSRPLTGTALGSLAMYSQSSGAFDKGQSFLGACPDDTGTYAYAIVSGWFSSSTTLSAGCNPGDTVLSLTSTSSWRTGGGYARVTTDAGTQMLVAYTGVSGSTLTGCSGVTATAASGKAVIPAPCVAKIQLSNLTAVGGTAYYYPLLVSPQTTPFYDAASGLVLFVGTDNKLYSLPASGGASPWTLTQVGSGAITPTQGSWDRLRYDSAAGIVWNASSGSSQRISGFYYKDPTGANADYTLAHHPMPYGYATGNHFMAAYGAVAFTPRAARMAVVQSTTNGSNHVSRWRADQMRCDILTDGSGRTNGSADGTSAGTAVSNATVAVYDPDGRLYVFVSTNMYAIDPTTEVLASGPTAIPAVIAFPPYILPAGGWSGGSNDQLMYMGGSGNGTLYLTN